jgi:hypothetical protein
MTLIKRMSAAEFQAAEEAGLITQAISTEFRLDESEVLIGTPENALVRPLTKNLIQAPEKAFKTTFLLRQTLGLSTGETVFPSLAVNGCHRVLYLHGELAPAELKERLQEASRELRRPLDQFFQGRSLTASLVTDEGRGVIKDLVEEFRPKVLVLDPWQSFIAGSDENSFKEMSGATKFLDNLISDHELAVFLAVHQGKDPLRGARGHSILAGWRDSKFTLKRNGSGLTVEVDPRWAEPPTPLTLTFHGGTLWEGDRPKWTKQAETIRELLIANGGEVTRKDLKFGLGLDDSSFRMALKRAHDGGALDLDGETVRLPASSSPPASPLPLI